MFRISNKNCQKLYSDILCEEEIDSSLNHYKVILEVILEKTGYTPEFKKILKCLFYVNLDEDLLVNNLECLDSFEDFQTILKTRKISFDLYNPILHKIIKFYKRNDVYHSNNIIFIEKILYGLSTDYKKVDKEIEECSSRFIVDLLIKMVLKDEVDIDFFAPNLPIENLYSINEEISTLIYNIYEEIVLLKEKYHDYIGSLGRIPTMLGGKIVFWQFYIDYFLSNQKNDYVSLKKILNNSIYDDQIANSFQTILIDNRKGLTDYFNTLFSNYSTIEENNMNASMKLEKKISD